MKEANSSKRTYETGAAEEASADIPQTDLETTETGAGATQISADDSELTQNMLRAWETPESGYYRFHNRHGE